MPEPDKLRQNRTLDTSWSEKDSQRPRITLSKPMATASPGKTLGGSIGMTD